MLDAFECVPRLEPPVLEEDKKPAGGVNQGGNTPSVSM